MVQQSEKYLMLSRVDKARGGGLDGNIREICAICNAALALKRIPIIPRENVNVKVHNFGKPLDDFKWSKYLDLDKTEIYKREENGVLKRESFPFLYVLEEDFNIKLYPQNQIRIVDREQLYDSENEKYKVLVATSIFQSPPYYIRPVCSQVVSDLTDIVLNRLGTSMSTMRDAQDLLYNRCSTAHLFEKIRHEKFFYSCLHIRANDMLLASIRSFQAVSRGHIKKLVHSACPPGTKLYIMSDTHNPQYFDFLRNRYDVYTYHDFPELERLVRKESRFSDNNLLFSVEKNIMEHALLKLVAATTESLPLSIRFYI